MEIQPYEIGAGITALLLFGGMFLTQMPKEWHTTGGWLLMSPWPFAISSIILSSFTWYGARH